MKNPAFHRVELLIGPEALERFYQTKVILFGIGGVGSWCAESLIRSGIGNLTIVDSDLVCVTNINRQLQATSETVGQAKVRVLRDRLLAINPNAQVTAIQNVYNRDTTESFDLKQYDYVLDAIDSLSCKVSLLMNAYDAGATVFTSLGASNRLDPTQIQVAPLWDSKMCRFGRYVRKKLRRRKFSGEIICVYSEELYEPEFVVPSGCGTGNCMCPKTAVHEEDDVHEWCSSKKQINGSMAHITGIFGFTLAGLVIQDILKKMDAKKSVDKDQPAEILESLN